MDENELGIIIVVNCGPLECNNQKTPNEHHYANINFFFGDKSYNYNDDLYFFR